MAAAFAQVPALEAELRISKEMAPPGGTAQITISTTEPKPIPTGRFSLDLDPFAGADIQGLAVNSAAGDASCAAVRGGGGLTIRCVSPKASMGLTGDYPMLTMVVQVPETAPMGLISPLRLDPSTFINDLLGVPYPLEVKNGSLTVADVAYISNVVPGGGPIAAGQQFEVRGDGFTPLSKLQVSGVALAWSRVVSPSLIVAAPAAATDLAGRLIRVRIGRTRLKYYSYLRAATAFQSRLPLLRRTVPMFSKQAGTDWVLSSVTADAKNPQRFTCVGIQNPNAGDVPLSLELTDGAGAVVGQRTIVVPGRKRFIAEVFELFPGVAAAPGRSLRLSSALPVQVMAGNGDSSLGEVVPVALAPAP